MLYVVPTPIGNLEDITLRAINVLREADFVIAENPAHTAKLLQHYELGRKEMLQFAEHNEQRVLGSLVAKLKSSTGALVSDAGTPGISDPGFRLIRECRRGGVQVVSLPGPSAVITALSGAGLPTDSFTFLGFVAKTEMKFSKQIELALKGSSTVVFYESPNRIKKTLEFLQRIDNTLQVCLARELTKIHEEYLLGSPQEVLSNITSRTSVKGEFVVIVSK